jgi:hypothetical protein
MAPLLPLRAGEDRVGIDLKFASRDSALVELTCCDGRVPEITRHRR